MIDVAPLIAVQQASYADAGESVRTSWPEEQALDTASMASVLERVPYCVLATSRPDGRAQAAPVAFEVRDGAFWIATMEGARLRNLRATAWAALVVQDGDRGSHSVVVAEGPVTLHHEAPGLPSWAAAAIELRPVRVLSYGPRG